MADRDILLAALRPSIAAYEEKTAGSTLLGRPDPDTEFLAPVSEAIEHCAAFQATKNQSLFTGRLSLKIGSVELAPHLFNKALSYIPDPDRDKVDEAASWLLRLLTTRDAKATLCAAIWGLSIDRDIAFENDSRLISFASLPESFVKQNIGYRSLHYDTIFPWINPRFHEVPRAAYVRDVPRFPYIRENQRAAYELIEELATEAREQWAVLQAASVGYPLAISFWLQYEDRDLHIEEWKMGESWSIPEIVPSITQFHPADEAAIRSDFANYLALPRNIRADALRSMTRFTLGQCRKDITDRVLDLTLAFEIAVSGGDQNLPVSWKVSVRSAQLIGGELSVRQKNRKTLTDLYALRSKAAHGSSLNSIPIEKQTTTIDESYVLYGKLIKCLLSHRSQPDWNVIEIEPRTRE